MTPNDTALAVLAQELGSQPPSELAVLSDAELRDLTCAIHDARRRQAHELAAAADAAFGYVPKLLRGPIKRVLR